MSVAILQLEPTLATAVYRTVAGTPELTCDLAIRCRLTAHDSLVIESLEAWQFGSSATGWQCAESSEQAESLARQCWNSLPESEQQYHADKMLASLRQAALNG